MEIYVARKSILNFFDWSIVRSRYYLLLGRPRLARIFDFVCDDKKFKAIVIAHALASVVFILSFPYLGRLSAIFALIVLFGHLSIHLRFLVGMDGADQMQTVVWAGIFFYSLDISNYANDVAIIFVVVQLLLSYFVAGIAKISSQTWRSGNAIKRIMRTSSYATPQVAQFTSNNKVSFLASWATILFEILCPFLILFGQQGSVLLISLGVLFHISVSLSMGLSTFLWAFGATMPLVYYVGGII